MVVQEKAQKVSKAVLIIMLIILLVFIIDTSVVALSTKSDINVDNYIGKTFVSKDLEMTITIASSQSINIRQNKRIGTREIMETEHDILLIHDIEGDFAIKFINEKTIYCEKTKQYLYLVNKEGVKNA